jgi:hypothetical protein
MDEIQRLTQPPVNYQDRRLLRGAMDRRATAAQLQWTGSMAERLRHRRSIIQSRAGPYPKALAARLEN